jgi:hypothetical protein
MQVTPLSISVCRLCKFYRPEGRRGGHCEKLDASVQGQWEACPLASHPFVSDWDEVSRLAIANRRVALTPILTSQSFVPAHHQPVTKPVTKPVTNQPLTICQPLTPMTGDRPLPVTALSHVDELWIARRTASA